jgi:hypothetical protein
MSRGGGAAVGENLTEFWNGPTMPTLDREPGKPIDDRRVIVWLLCREQFQIRRWSRF